MSRFFSRPLFILGLPRSGTSMVAGILKKTGFWCGSTLNGDGNNPKGYFEHKVVREQIIKPMLTAMDCDPLGVRRLPDLDALESQPKLKRRLYEVLKSDGYRDQRPWLYKDAKLTLLWPLFREAFPEARWLIVKRDVDSFVGSCLRTSFMRQHSSDPEFWRAFADAYDQRIEALKSEADQIYEVYTPDFFSGDYTALESLSVDFGIEFDTKKAAKFVEGDHWHGNIAEQHR